jgi:hypothetical protein
MAGCRCAGEAPPAPTASAAGAAAVAAPQFRRDCGFAGTVLTLQPSGAAGGAVLQARAQRSASPDADPDPDSNVDLPFSVEPGMAVEHAGRFYATALRHESRGSVALLVRLGGGEPATLELGRVEGDVPPPRLTLDGDDVLVSTEEAAGSTYRVRVARLPRGEFSGDASKNEASKNEASKNEALRWQEGPRPSRDESNAYDLAAARGRVTFAWDDFPKGESHGRVYVSNLAADAAGASAPSAVSGADVDAEEPRIAARPGGYWLAWLVDVANASGRARVYDPGEADEGSASAGAAGVAAAKAAGARGAQPPAGAAGAGPSSGPGKAGAYGARGIEVLPLDEAGKPAGNVRRIRTGDARVVGYDLVTSAAGQAWLVWRQDAPSPGASGGRVLMAEVQSEGPREALLVSDEDVGSGAPGWLPIGGSSNALLTFPDQRDRTLLLHMSLPNPLPQPLELAPEVQGAAALAAASGQVLFALPRGRALELFLACQR